MSLISPLTKRLLIRQKKKLPLLLERKGKLQEGEQQTTTSIKSKLKENKKKVLLGV